MMKTRNTNENYSIGLTFFDALCLIFITLKLTHVINWSWWWVLSPIWICILIVIVIGIIIVMVNKR